LSRSSRRQLEELDRQRAREQQLREQQYAWELEDFQAAKAEQLQAAQDWYDEQIAELKKAQERENILRAIQWQRQDEDFERNRQRQLQDARRWYEQEREELAEHLEMTGDQLEAAYQTWQQDAADAAAEVAKSIVDAWSAEIDRYQQYQEESPEIERYASQRPTGTASRSSPQIIVGDYDEVLREWAIPGTPILSMAEGGIVTASSPTHIVMGDAGTESAMFVPGKPPAAAVSKLPDMMVRLWDNLRGSREDTPVISMAQGGVITASSPTEVVMGDAGTETGLFIPGKMPSGGGALPETLKELWNYLRIQRVETPTVSMAKGGTITASSPVRVIMGDAGTETGVFVEGKPPAGVTPDTLKDLWAQQREGGSAIAATMPTLSMAGGGVVRASSPTQVIMGDRGPETGVFMPGGAAQSLSVQHDFGRLGIDFAGLPGGMNTQQVQAIVYATITQLAQSVELPRI